MASFFSSLSFIYNLRIPLATKNLHTENALFVKRFEAQYLFQRIQIKEDNDETVHLYKRKWKGHIEMVGYGWERNENENDSRRILCEVKIDAKVCFRK